MFREAQGTPRAEQLTDAVTPAQRRADALGLLAEAALTADLDRGSAGDRYQVVLHVEAPSRVAAEQGLSGTVEVDHGAVDVSAETSRRISCDASVVAMRHDADGAVLDVGRKTRTVPPSIRRALQARDRSCRFPGCTARRCDAHHIEHWVDGGPTRLDNLVLLCRRHHRAVHEGGFDLIEHATPRRPSSVPIRRVFDAAPPLPVLSSQIGTAFTELDDIPVWDGTPFDLAYALTCSTCPRQVTPGLAPRLPASPNGRHISPWSSRQSARRTTESPECRFHAPSGLGTPSTSRSRSGTSSGSFQWTVMGFSPSHEMKLTSPQ